ncbi:hypothetical protein [Archaeoglobus sp.]
MNGENGVKKERFEVWQVEERKFSVLSLDSTSGKPKQYCVQFNGYRWLCNCPHYLKHCDDVNFACKHIVAVMQVIGRRTTVEKRVRNGRKREVKPSQLPYAVVDGNRLRCHRCGSGNLEMLSFQPNADKALEVYRCEDCGEIQKNII